MNVAERVTWFRKKKGFTVNKLANEAGISQSYLREIELGRKNPTVETLSVLCDALGTTLKEFFDDESVSPLETDELAAVLFKLSKEQRKRLAEFLKSMQN